MAAPSQEVAGFDTTAEGSEELLSFVERSSPCGVEIIDHIEQRRCRIETPSSIESVACSTSSFYMPVDRGIEFTTTEISIPHTAAIFVRNSWGLMVDELSNGDSREFPTDQYSVEITASIKLYINFTSDFSISVEQERIRVEFPEPITVAVGARSHHDHPAGTITVTSDPEDMMEAISHLGSSLKTLTCERSYPTLRGHPPTIELGDELHIPEYLEPPDSGVTIEIPPTLVHLFVVSPLAFYTAARVTPGEHPRLRTESGFTHDLTTPDRGFEAEVERVLKQLFFLDCLTRTEGYYQVDLAERNRIEPYVDLDFGELYDQPIATQIERYLSIPYDAIEGELPNWKLTAHVEPDPEYVEYLPFLIQDLAIIRTADGEQISPAEVGANAIEEFIRNGTVTTRAGQFRSSATTFSRSSSTNSVADSLVDPGEVDSLEHAWVGPGVPVGASKSLIEAFHNRLDKKPSSENIEITVICNDRDMSEESDLVNSVYGQHEDLSFEKNVFCNLTTSELRNVLEQDIDFLHYIGHIDKLGFECDDGRLDASEIGSIGVDTFFLNACTSYRQGESLIQAGSVAGVVTLNDVVNSGAEIVGKSLAKLLNNGFPFRAALSIAQTQSIMGNQYIVLGDGNADIANPLSGTALLLQIEESQSDHHLSIRTFPTGDRNMGSMFIPYLENYDTYHLCSGELGPFNLLEDSVVEYLDRENFPLLRNRTLYWSHENEIKDWEF